MTDAEREAELFAQIDRWGDKPDSGTIFPVHDALRFLRRILEEERRDHGQRITDLMVAHDRRVSELLAANTREVEHRRALEGVVRMLQDNLHAAQEAWIRAKRERDPAAVELPLEGKVG